MAKKNNSITHRILSLLVNGDVKRLSGNGICKATGISERVFSHRIGIILKARKISRNMLASDPYKVFHYFLTPEQRRMAIAEYDCNTSTKDDSLMVVTDTVDIPRRLKFLRMLRENTVFSGHAELNNIIADYERTLKLRNQIDAAREEADKNDRKAA